eukprot:scaffold95494_cov63-Phaeocystis_antarctica.AAC.1
MGRTWHVCKKTACSEKTLPLKGARAIAGFERYCPPTRASSEVHRSCADGRGSTRHLHGITKRAARCDTVK